MSHVNLFCVLAGDQPDNNNPTGAHVRGFNNFAIGVALIGDFREVAPTSAAMSSLGRLLNWLCEARDPVRVNVHSELDGDTECPGSMLASELHSLIEARAPMCRSSTG